MQIAAVEVSVATVRPGGTRIGGLLNHILRTHRLIILETLFARKIVRAREIARARGGFWEWTIFDSQKHSEAELQRRTLWILNHTNLSARSQVVLAGTFGLRTATSTPLLQGVYEHNNIFIILGFGV